MQLITWLLRLIIFIILINFATANQENVTISYFQDKFLELPLSVALLMFFALGVILTIISVPRKSTVKKS